MANCTGRYNNLPPMVRYTLPRLLTNDRTRQLLVHLRADGWLDWHCSPPPRTSLLTSASTLRAAPTAAD